MKNHSKTESKTKVNFGLIFGSFREQKSIQNRSRRGLERHISSNIIRELEREAGKVAQQGDGTVWPRAVGAQTSPRGHQKWCPTGFQDENPVPERESNQGLRTGAQDDGKSTDSLLSRECRWEKERKLPNKVRTGGWSGGMASSPVGSDTPKLSVSPENFRWGNARIAC